MKAHVKLWKKFKDLGLSMWVFDGRLVRSVFDIDFRKVDMTTSMNLFPRMKFRIDNDLEEAERPYVFFMN